MTRTGKALCSILAAAAITCSAQTDFDWTSIKPSTVLKWKSCYGKGFECARLTMPLDYANPKSTKTAAIAVTRFLSTSSPTKYRGPLLINPGGPAGSGVEWVLEVGQQLATVVGPEYDIVGFDPRGTSFSTPLVSWFADDSERATWLPPSENTVYQSVNQSTDSLAHLYARAQIQAALAAARNTDGYLQFITTDYTAQDMLTITEAFGFKKLQYWGISYGSVIGATFAAKFPDKVERLIIDGVVPLEAWYTANMTNTVQDADKALGIFVSACFAAGPSLCAFHNNATSAADIASSIQTLLLSIQQTPVPAIIAPISGSLSYGVVDYTFVKNVILDTLYHPYTLFPILAQALADLANGDASTIFLAATAGTEAFTCSSNAPLDHSFESAVSIVCGDGVEVNDTIPQLQAFYETEVGVSKNFADLLANWRILCAGWKVLRPGRFAGPFGANTSFPLLIIGNTADHVTPLAGAKKTASLFPGSALLTYNTVGHTSVAASSTCIYGYMRAYFRDGTLPPPGTICQPDETLFNSTATAGVLRRDSLVGMGTGFGKRMRPFYP